MTQPSAEKHAFKSELRQILHLITHSLYSHKEIFLRELLSNASDAIDKIRFNSLENAHLLGEDKDFHIRLTVDKAAATLMVTDNGIGMTRDELIENLGTIAKSGTRAFLERLQQADAATKPELIGQFGVGFYSAFMVADKVTVVSRAAGSDAACRWESDGQGEYTLEPTVRAGRGTDVILHLKAEEHEFLESWRLRSIVKQFSDFIEHPIQMDVERKDGETTTVETETLNSQKALWLRSKSDITEEEHHAFYRQVSGDFEDPAKVIHYVGEGSVEFRALLYIPKHKTFDLQFGEPKVGPRLYINRVLIQEHCEPLMPPYLRFVKGVVDCPDLPLNVSRELLQSNPLLEKIEKILVKQVLKALDDLRTESYDTYVAWHKELGGILKEGLARDWNHKEAIADLLLVESLKTEPGSFTTLAKLVEAMPEDQKDLYYVTGEDRAALAASPVLEAFKAKGWDVALLTDPVDPFVFPSLSEFKGKSLKPADRHVPETPAEDRSKLEAATQTFEGLLGRLKGWLPQLKDVRLTQRLKESAACLVADEGALDPQVERIMARLGQREGGPSPRILELNPDHPVVKQVLALQQQAPEDPRLEGYGRLLYDQALLAEGSRLDDPAGFVARLNALMLQDAQRS